MIWLGHASVRLSSVNLLGRKVIYIDPYQISDNSPKADLILITHGHFDHFSPNDIKKLLKANTVVFAPSEINMSEIDCEPIIMKPGSSITSNDIGIKAVPAYNTDKEFHPKEEDLLGYIVDFEGTKYYHAGDSDFIPEMHGINTDVAFLPIGGTYTMNYKEACDAAKAISPKCVVPIHWGTLVGSKEDAENFKAECPVKVEILRKNS